MNEQEKKEKKEDFPGIKNLTPFNTLSVEEQRKIASMGGKKSVEVRRRKKHLKELLTNILNSNAPEDSKEKLGVFFPGLTIETIEETMNLSLIRRVLEKGDTKAYEAIYDRVEGKPIQKNVNENYTAELTKQEMDDMDKNFNAGENVTKNN